MDAVKKDALMSVNIHKMTKTKIDFKSHTFLKLKI